MWTHAKPYLQDELTVRSIDYHARVALYRSLNIGRAVAMVGSGATASHGKPTWSELAAKAVRYGTKILYPDGERPPRWSNEIEQLERELQMLICPKDLPVGWDAGDEETRLAKFFGDFNVDQAARTSLLVDLFGIQRDNSQPILEVLDDLLGLVEKSDVMRERNRRKNDNGEWLEEELKKLLEEIRESSEPKDPRRIEQLVRKRLRDENTSESLSIKLRRQLCSFLADDDGAARAIGNGQPDQKIDVLQSMIGDLKLKRFLTLNYDVEIERSVLERSQNLKANTDGAFEHLVEAPLTSSDSRRSASAHVEFATGAQRIATSSTFTEETIGELVNFSAYAHGWGRQIFHLHGRIDEPESLILTQSDYLRRYAKDEVARRTFDEARELLFSGNDLLFVGVGMGEADVLKPLRQFAARQLARSQRQSQIFALMPSSYDKNWYRSNAEQAVTLKSNYGVSTIFYGSGTEQKDVAFREEMRAHDDALKALGGIAASIFKGALDDPAPVIVDKANEHEVAAAGETTVAQDKLFEPQQELANLERDYPIQRRPLASDDASKESPQPELIENFSRRISSLRKRIESARAEDGVSGVVCRA